MFCNFFRSVPNVNLFKIAALEESQSKLQEKLAELEKGQTAAPAAVTEETKDAPMEESEPEAPAAPAAAVTEASPEPELTKEAEKTEAETPAPTTEEPKGELIIHSTF